MQCIVFLSVIMNENAFGIEDRQKQRYGGFLLKKDVSALIYGECNFYVFSMHSFYIKLGLWKL